MNFFAGDGDEARSINAAANAREDRKIAGLRRMRRTALCLLVLMIALLFACVVWQAQYPWLAWPRAFAEAGTVGAIADWYAVVALFRRPLGLPIPHTAIISQNQQRIAESLGHFVEENFLTPDLIVDRLGSHDAAKALAQWLAQPANSRGVADVAADAVAGLLAGMNEKDVQWFFDHLVIPQLRTLDVSRMAGNVLQILTEDERHQPWLDHGLDALEKWLVANVEMIKAKFSETSKYTPARLDAYIVRKFVEGIIALLHEAAASPDHELRRQFDETVRELIVQLQTSPVHRRFGRSLMRDCIRHFRQADYYRVPLDRLREHVIADLGREPSAMRDAFTRMLVSLGKRIGREPEIQRKLNAWWLTLARELVTRYGRQVSVLITEVVKGWDAEEVSRKIETEIGRDLQYVRINGTFVGGMVGLLLHAATLFVMH
ncbi:DUF445 domain-containing protein [Paraburkholderia megapolitana]|uniref:Uncharacterized membrane-anchored protein YjiN, DUF445 family n=2 Tax=Paraburkholderia megapolitana TaxID=420953 RepID=A0A1I3N6G3_9BURK|nr:DUF445 domain-containing protein [Paraburkholderia megapolitana]SFJ04782.1 Uncharacterized membrane-anchored protein YjiN, DUF445 family [Paraburkholderia megapolitana]